MRAKEKDMDCRDENMLSAVKNRLLQQLAMSAPGGASLRVALHRLRGVRIGKDVWIGYQALIETGYPTLVSIGDRAIIGIRSIPKIIEAGFLQVIEKIVIVRESVGNRGDADRAHALLRRTVHGGDLINIRLSVDDFGIEIAISRRGEQTSRVQQRKRPIRERTVNAITGEVALRVPIPMQDDALIARAR